MSTLLLDDVGMGLLRQLAEAWEASEEYALTASEHIYMVTSYNDLWRLSFEYNALVAAYVEHLRFCLINRSYWARLTHALTCDDNFSIDIAMVSDRSDFIYIAKKSIEAYRRGNERRV